MISYSDALKIVEKKAIEVTLTTECLPFEKSLGRIAAQTLLSEENLPEAANSAMDGFALQAQWTHSASTLKPLRIPIVASLAAGDPLFVLEDTSVSAVEIMTGAFLPQGPWDAVVRIEDVELEQNEKGQVVAILLREPVLSGANVRPLGSDFSKKDVLLNEGTKIEIKHLMAMAALGIKEVRVFVKPRAWILSTGNEIVEPSTSSKLPHQIRNSSSIALLHSLEQLNCSVQYKGIFHDNAEKFESCVERALGEKVDILVSTGAVSMGKFDFIKDSCLKMGAKVLFHKVAIRPGKPILFVEFSRDNHSLFLFALPGNPLSTLVGQKFFIEPFIKILNRQKNKSIKVPLENECFQKPEKFHCFFLGEQVGEGAEAKVRVAKDQSSYKVSNLLKSPVWVEIPDGCSQITRGTPLKVYPLLGEEYGS